ncbi:protein trichome birefringence-like 5 [Telopea speciosissima]|uniref:protein trichome birefringence-like 5 n=1 Tax=Telopea speciosissima TaxID=54955 RepID=UPI001CC39AA8|nr:protein trichome birefringence-like 5 [Telopea speciosissima]
MAMLPKSGGLKNRHTFSAFIFLLLLLLTIFFFSKRVLEPSLSLYRDPNFQSTSLSSEEFAVPVVTLDLLADPPVNEASLQQPVSPIPEPISRTEPKTESSSDVKDESSNGEFSSGVNVGLPIETNSSPKKVPKMCDFYRGMWVNHNDYPLYQPNGCPYVDEAYSCQENGRRDSEYMKWRWKPEGCDLPRFNATDFLERLRGKRLMLVGDSMNRNQFESIICLLREGLSNKSRMYEAYGHKITKGRGYFLFKFMDYNCSVEFVRSHFLVKEGTRVNGQGNSNPTLSIDRIDKTSNRWKHADILVFNTGHWWTHGKTARGKNYYKEGDFLYPRLDAIEAYKRAMKTWGKWIDQNINPAKKLVFYRGYSSAHFRGGDWDSGGTCHGETQPILSGAFLDNYPLKMKIVEEVLREMRVPVVLLNVTRMTNFRKDGHPSIYGKNQTGVRKVSRRQDCSHWCLPGVPDAWNELIYSKLILQKMISSD